MNALIMIAGVVFPLAAVGVAVWAGVRRMKKTGSGKKAFIRHLVVLGTMLVMCLGFSMMASAAAGDPAPAPEEASAAQPAEKNGLVYLAAGLSTGLGAIGGGIALASGAPAAIGAVSEDPKTFGKALTFCALGETMGIYGVVVSFVIILL